MAIESRAKAAGDGDETKMKSNPLAIQSIGYDWCSTFFFHLNINVSFVKTRNEEKSTFDTLTRTHTSNKNFDYLNLVLTFPGIVPIFFPTKHWLSFHASRIRTFLFCMHVRVCVCVLIQIYWIYAIEEKTMLTFYKLNIPLDKIDR